MPPAAEGIVQALKEAGVTTVFGIPSVHNIGLYEALRHERSIRHIVCRHEAAATHMADGYARASGGPGVIIFFTPPGARVTISALPETRGGWSPMPIPATHNQLPQNSQKRASLHQLQQQN